MKKSIILIIIFVLFGLYACGGGASTTNNSQQGTNSGCTKINEHIIYTDMVLDKACYLSSGLRVADTSKLTILPGVTVYFSENSSLSILGSLVAQGSNIKPITFTVDNKSTRWNGIEVVGTSHSNILDNVIVEHGTDNISIGPFTHNKQTISITNVISRYASKYGIVLWGNTKIDSFINNTFTLNQFPIHTAINLLPLLGNNNQFIGNTMDRIFIRGNYQRVDIASSFTFPKLEIPYFVSGEIQVEAPLTIEPGVKFEFDNVMGGLFVIRGGSIVANGTITDPITFTSTSKTPGAWRGIRIQSSNEHLFNYVTIEYAKRNIETIIDGTGIPTRMTVTNSKLLHASDYGMEISSSSLVSFRNNIFESNNKSLRLGSSNVEKLDYETVFIANLDRFIHVDGINSFNIKKDQIWKNLSQDYLLNGLVLDVSQLSIEPGTTLVFESNGYIHINDGSQLTKAGSIIAVGTVDKPITFTGLEKTPGYWNGLEFNSTNFLYNNRLEHVVVEYGGGINNDGNITLSCYSGLNLSVINSSIENGSGWGIDRTFGSINIDTCNLLLTNVSYSNNAKGGLSPIL